MNQKPENQLTSRRDFIKTSAVIGGAIAAPAILPGRLFAAENSDTLKIGLVGCGGRGPGAALQALTADKNVVLTAVGDVFADRINSAVNALKKEEEVGSRVKVEDDHRFIGLDAYQKVINSGVDVVILTTPPAFRPQHLKAAIEAGKHVFCEKPVATDAAGVRSAIASAEEAKKKNLALVAGFCWRYAVPERALFERILDGAIGDVQVFYGTYYTQPVNPIPPVSQRPAEYTDLAWQLRMWQNFTWLSGDSIVEQAVHAVDWMCWTMKEVPPVKAVATGGRQIPAHGGNIFDHFAVNYEYENGARGFIGSRQQSGCMGDNSATIYGTKGVGRELGFASVPWIKGENAWHYDKKRAASKDMYQIEHDEMFASIRAGKPINNGPRLANSTMVAIMGRMAAYTGLEITWEQALNSTEVLVPSDLTWDMSLSVAPIAQPGKTRFV